jgi:hypothetical protein
LNPAQGLKVFRAKEGKSNGSLTRLEPFGKRRKEFGETEGRKAERVGASESISRIQLIAPE